MISLLFTKDSLRFDEDGSWIGQYGTINKKQKRISNELTAASASAGGATYV